jgi:hypothetical protein
MRSRASVLLLLVLLVLCAGCAAAATELPPVRTTYIGATPAFADLAYEWLDGFSAHDPEHELTLRVLPLEAGLESARAGDIAFLIAGIEPPAGWFAAPLERTALLIVTGSGSSSRNLTLRQLREIYTGQVTDWEQLGGDALEIQPMLYPEGDELQASFESLVMEGNRLTANARLLPDPASMAEEVSSTPGAIGFLPGYALPSGLRALAIGGDRPSSAGIINGSYPLALTVVALAPAEPGDLARAWLGWIQAGQ